uniref:Uncharacterized protein n=1 Tax=Arion vulgaris TaxID=1028688 RepID=A0A0B7ANT7_9EUPU
MPKTWVDQLKSKCLQSMITEQKVYSSYVNNVRRHVSKNRTNAVLLHLQEQTRYINNSQHSTPATN